MVKIIEKTQMTIGVITLSIFFIAIIIQIVSRHIGIAIIWTEEVANYSFIWSIFMGASVMVYQREHFSFDFLTIRMTGKKKSILMIVIDIFILLFSVAILYYGIEAAITFWNYNWVALPEMKMGYVWISLPIMGFTMAVYTISHLFNSFKELKKGAWRMIGILLVIIFLVLMIIGVPIAFVIGIVSFIGVFSIENLPEVTVPIKMLNGIDSFVLLAVPLFILAANLMNHGKISQKLIDLSLTVVGHIRGGLAHSNVLVSMIFAGVSGAAQADTAGVGKILIPNMKKQGYDTETAVAVTAASSTIGVIIPPSIPMIIFAGLSNASIGALFLGGIVPGILIGVGMMVFIYFMALKKGYPRSERATF